MRNVEIIRLSVAESYAKLPSDVAFAERNHTEGVAECAQKLAEIRGLDPELAWMAGMLHDMGRIQAGKETKRHGKVGADLAKTLLSSIPGLTGKERKRIVEAIRLHVRKNRIDDPFSELLKDADAWQLTQREETVGLNPYRQVRALLADTQRDVRVNGSAMEWPPLKQPTVLAEDMERECQELSLALIPFLDDEKKQPHISRHAVHVLRQQTRKLTSLLTYFHPLLPAAPCDNMLAALRVVLSVIGAVRDVDVLLAWIHKALSPEELQNPPETPEMTEPALYGQASLPCRLQRMREKRLMKAVSRVRQVKKDIDAFSDAGAFSFLSLLPAQELTAFHAEKFTAFRRSLSADAVLLIRKMERKEKADRAMHKLRLQAKFAHYVLMTMHAAPYGTDPRYPVLMDALAEIRILLGDRQDTATGTALLKKVSEGGSKKKKHSEDHPSPVPDKWRRHVIRVARHTEKKAHSLLFILQKLL